MSQLSPAKKIVRATNKLLLNEVFFGVLLLRLKIIEDPECQTFWVDGTSLGYNPKFVETLSNNEIVGVLAHEVMHCVFAHPTRKQNRNHAKWNIAGDYVINAELLNAGFTLPTPHLYDEKYEGMTTDHVYTLLPDLPDLPKLMIEGSSIGEVRPQKIKTSSQQKAEEKEWTIAVHQAAQTALQQGSLSDNLKRLVDLVATPKVPWKELLRNFMTNPKRNDYTLTRPNRRFISSNIYLPSLYTEGLGTVIITVDTSGSITNEQLAEFQSEINCILEDTQPEKVIVLYCDTEVHKDIDEFTFDDLPVKLTMRGGGGTDFTEPFKWVIDNNEQPALFIYFTDLYGSCNAPPPDYSTLWVCTTEQTDIPFGELISMN
jgi:predicted metal-dependent peptidase